VLHRRARERLMVRVDHRELQTLEVLHLQAIDGIRARAADADELDRDVAIRKEGVFEGKFVQIHALYFPIIARSEAMRQSIWNSAGLPRPTPAGSQGQTKRNGRRHAWA